MPVFFIYRNGIARPKRNAVGVVSATSMNTLNVMPDGLQNSPTREICLSGFGCSGKADRGSLPQ